VNLFAKPRPPPDLSGDGSCSHAAAARSTAAQDSSITSLIKVSPAALCQGALKRGRPFNRKRHGSVARLQ